MSYAHTYLSPRMSRHRRRRSILVQETVSVQNAAAATRSQPEASALSRQYAHNIGEERHCVMHTTNSNYKLTYIRPHAAAATRGQNRSISVQTICTYNIGGRCITVMHTTNSYYKLAYIRPQHENKR